MELALLKDAAYGINTDLRPHPYWFHGTIEYPSASLSKCSNLFALGPRPQRCNKFQGGAAMKTSAP